MIQHEDMEPGQDLSRSMIISGNIKLMFDNASRRIEMLRNSKRFDLDIYGVRCRTRVSISCPSSSSWMLEVPFLP